MDDMAKTIIIRYGELALKSERVRRRFEQRLINNIERALRGLSYRIRKERGRIFIDTSSASALSRMTKVPGVVSVSSASKTKATVGAICKSSVIAARRILKSGEAFAVRASRVGEHDFSSQEINEAVGSAILKAVPTSKVNLSHPDHTIFIEVRGGDAYIFTEKRAGVGGLPVGTQGKVVVLLSGGIDSPVAAYLAMKRGCLIFPIFFDNRPYTDKRTRERAIAISKKLTDFYQKIELRVVPFGEILRNFIEKAPRELTCVLCKRAMFSVANRVAEQVGAGAIATGESLGQVASQTLINLSVIDEASKLLVLRPLIGMDKVEIERIARSISTFETSTKPASGCSAVPPYPETYASLEKVIEGESRFDMQTLIESALAKSKVISVGG